MDKVKNCSDFASICSFLELFSEDLTIHISIPQLVSSIVQVDAPTSPSKSEFSEPVNESIKDNAETGKNEPDDTKVAENQTVNPESLADVSKEIEPEVNLNNMDKSLADNDDNGKTNVTTDTTSQNTEEKAQLANGVNHSEEEDELEIFRVAMSVLPLTPRLRKSWVSLHVRLLNKIGIRTQEIKWERGLGKFMALLNTCLSVDQFYAFDNKGYTGLDVLSRTKLLAHLLEYQFEKNAKFKEKVNSLPLQRLRPQPLGIDVFGFIYWLFQDPNHNFLLYQENPDDDSIKLLCETIHQLKRLLNDLKSKRECILGTSSSENQSVNTENPDETNVPPANLSLPLLGPIYKRFIGESPSSSSAATTENSPRPDNHQNGSETLQIKLNQEVFPHEDKIISEPESSTLNNNESIKLEQKPESIDQSESNENKNLSPEENSPSKSRRGSRVKVTPVEIQPDESNQNSDPCNGVRRSCRQRKQVELFGAATQFSPRKIEKKNKDSCSPSKPVKDANPKISEGKTKSRSKKNIKRKSNSSNDSDENLPLSKLRGKKIKSKETDISKSMKKELPKKNIKSKKYKSKTSKPWEADSSDDASEEPDFDHEFFVEEESESEIDLNVGDNWTDAPESDFDEVVRAGESSDEELLKQRGRNYARQKRRSMKVKPIQEAPVEETPCQICGESKLPEWLLLCDECDLGFHTMCLRPALMIIPEGDWFCPRCQHKSLIDKLEERIKELSSLAAKKSTKLGIEERLNFVNISMTNILGENISNRTEAKKVRYYSNSESEEYSNENGSESDESFSSSSSSSSEESVEQRRPTRQRREVKYNYDEFDKMICEAIEEDEKYLNIKKKKERLKKKESLEAKEVNECESVKSDDGSEVVEDEEDISDASAPKGKSRGKDMANILGPDWDKSDEDKPKPVGRRGRKKLTTNLSSGESANEEDDDDEFKLSDEDVDSDEEAEEAKYRSKGRGRYRDSDESWDDNLSDESWSLRRSRRETRYSSGRRSSRNKKSHKSKHKRRKASDSDDDYMPRRTRRAAARARVNYRAMEETSDEESDKSESEKAKKTFHRKKNKLSSEDDEYRADSRANSESDSCDEAVKKTSQSQKRKRIIDSSSDDSNQQPCRSLKSHSKRLKDEEDEEEENEEAKVDRKIQENVEKPKSDTKAYDDEDIPECSDVLPELNESDLEAAEAMIDFVVDDNSNSNMYQPNLP